MSDHDCCSATPTGDHATRACPTCGQIGKRVPEETPAALVRPETAGRVVAGIRYRLCRSRGCPVAYYPDSAGASPIETSALRVAVGQKGEGDPRPLCYCFHFTEADVAARLAGDHEPVSAEVRRKMKEPGCACATENPAGTCCLKEVQAAERRLAEVSSVAPRSLGAMAAAPKEGRRRGLLGLVAMLPGIGAALLPAVACPACWPAYAGLLSSLGIGFVSYTPWLLSVTLLFLLVALIPLALGARRRRSYGPLLLGTAGAAVLAAGRFALHATPVMVVGVVALVAASAWNAWPRRAACSLPPGDSECGCGP